MSLQPGNFIPQAVLETATAAPAPASFHVMLKPSGPICNIDCGYCFYLRKEELYEAGTPFRMDYEVLESFTRQYVEGQRVPEVTFGWQGGEPTLMGLAFFRKAVAFQQKYARPGMRVLNSFQTNGILVNEEWARFFKENRFLVGLSLDGPRDLHDAYRVDKAGNPTFERVYRALKLLQRHEVEYNILCVVNRRNCEHPARVYRFYRDEGVRFIQFIPAVEGSGSGQSQHPTPTHPHTHTPTHPMASPWSVPPEGWGSFLCGVFDEWIRQDVGKVSIQHFEVALQSWVGMRASLCVHAETCGNCLAMEHNGDLFSCDHFVSPEYYLGNILRAPLTRMVASPFEQQFGRDKRESLPRQCRECPVLFACNGGCPKDRFLHTKDGDPGLNYLCAGYYRFFNHVAPYMQKMADLHRRGYPPAAIMDLLPRPPVPTHKAGRNDPCPCGSGRKFKQCCARSGR